MDRLEVLKSKISVERDILRGSSILLCLFMAQAIAVFLTMWSHDLLNHFKPSLYAQILIVSLGVVVFIKGLSYVLLYMGYEKHERGISRIRTDFLEGWLNINFMVAFLVPMLFLPTFMSLFSSMKSIIHLVQPFYLDEFLMKADRFVHFGVDPWKITHSIFGTPALSAMLNYFYNLWFFIMFSFVLWQIVNVKFGRARLQFLFSFVIIWPLVGSLLAVILSSAGPVYYGNIVGDHTIYGPLMESLKAFDQQLAESGFSIFALNTQDMLWADYIKNDTNVGSGISAMPSMHVAIAALLYFSGREVHKFIGIGMLAFLVIIQIGSVHLGWHYALDGYFSILVTWGIWKFSGWLVTRVYGSAPQSTAAI